MEKVIFESPESPLFREIERVFSTNLGIAANQDIAWKNLTQIFQKTKVPFHVQKELFDKCFSKRSRSDGPPIVWTPKSPEKTNLWKSMQEKNIASVKSFHQWSVTHPEEFWKDALTRIGALPKNHSLILDKNSDVRNPEWFPNSEFDVVSLCFQSPPTNIAIVSASEESSHIQQLTYGDLQKLTNRVANGIRNIGLSEGDCIAIDMPMMPESVAIYLGIIRAGGIVVSIADSFTAPEIQRRLEISRSKAIFTVDTFMRGGKRLEMYAKIKQANAPCAIVLGANTHLRKGDYTWEAFLGDDIFVPRSFPPQTLTNILFSSGTTGDPKMIPWTQLTPLKAAVDGYYHHDIHPQDTLCWPTNLGWMMGPWLIYAAFVNKAKIALFNGAATGKEFGAFVEKAKVTMLGVVPSLVKVWRQSGCMENYNWSHLKAFSSTGECSNATDYLYLMSLCNYQVPIIEYCGGTEIGGGFISGTLLQNASPARFTTPSFGVDLCILHEDGSAANVGEPGEAFLVPPSIGLSQLLLNRDHHEVYYKNCPLGPHGQILRRHGDVLERENDNFYRHHGRADDTMNLGGIKVSSAELEIVVNKHPEVVESAAISVPEAGGGIDRLVLFVVSTSKSHTLKSEVQELLKKELNPLFKIHDLAFVSSLPRTASNKVMRRILRQEYIKQQ